MVSESSKALQTALEALRLTLKRRPSPSWVELD
jgi:hypothetical protein